MDKLTEAIMRLNEAEVQLGAVVGSMRGISQLGRTLLKEIHAEVSRARILIEDLKDNEPS